MWLSCYDDSLLPKDAALRVGCLNNLLGICGVDTGTRHNRNSVIRLLNQLLDQRTARNRTLLLSRSQNPLTTQLDNLFKCGERITAMSKAR